MKNKCKISIKKDGKPLYIEKGGKIECTKNIAEINSLIYIFNTKINFLKTVIAASENPEDVNEKVRKIEKPRPDEVETEFVSAKKVSINSLEFKNGLASARAELGDKFLNNREMANATLCFKSNHDIYYEDKLVVKEGENIPYFAQIQAWSEDQYPDGIAKVMFDLRPAGVYGIDFDTKKLNNGMGRSGEDFDIKATPTYQVRV